MSRPTVAMVVLACGGALALAGCGGKSVETTPASGGTHTVATSTVTVTASRTASPSPSGSPSAPATAKVGSTISLAGTNTGESADVTVTKVVDPASPTDSFSTPSAGKRFVAVQFVIKNTGSTTYSDSPSNGAKVIDSTDQSFNASYQETAAGPGFAGSVDLPPGQSGRGYITFEVPTTSQLILVQFALDSGFANQVGQWSLK
ncbi:DUF4352 domain-containing protein [Kitasatospora sp. NPDC059646]|uniref:DUF4352 domain-containing protein n=1 Tax=Kitasatospora sp. NPDC059646 TaxID=3346893 RepID=UPI00367CA749